VNVDFDGAGAVDPPDPTNAPEVERERPTTPIKAERLTLIAKSWRRRKGAENAYADMLMNVIYGEKFANGAGRHEAYLALTWYLAKDAPDAEPGSIGDLFQRSLDAEGIGDRRGDVERAFREAVRKHDEQKDVSLVAGAERYFRTPEGKAYAVVRVNGHLENMPVRSQRFKEHLCLMMYERSGKAPGSDAVQAAINTIAAKANRGEELSTHVRVAEHGASIWIDIGDKDRRAIEVTAKGWNVRPSHEVPVRFIHPKGLLPLPVPERGGDAEGLRDFVNVTEEDWPLMLAWLLAALRPKGPYAILVLQGLEGTAKSTTTKALRRLVDPNIADLRRKPKEPRDLNIAANNGHVIALTNLSGIPTELSDVLCCIASGEGFATRTLFTDDDEAIFTGCRPIIVNGIDALATRGDFASRSIVLALPRLEKHRDEDEFWAAFDAAKAKIFGGLLDLLVVGLLNLPKVKIDKSPRMADFALWGEACLPGRAFLAAFLANQKDAAVATLENNPVATALIAFGKGKAAWKGTATELLTELSGKFWQHVGKGRDDNWPRTAGILSARLNRAERALEHIGIKIEFCRSNGERWLEITFPPPAGSAG
jgi:hypothetical protein